MEGKPFVLAMGASTFLSFFLSPVRYHTQSGEDGASCAVYMYAVYRILDGLQPNSLTLLTCQKRSLTLTYHLQGTLCEQVGKAKGAWVYCVPSEDINDIK